MSHFNIAISTVLFHEGGYVNDPQDPGGATNYGISLRWLKEVNDLEENEFIEVDFDHDGFVSAADIAVMSKEEAIQLYRQQWWDKYHYGLIQDAILATKIFDLAINMGVTAAHRCLQRAIRAATGESLVEDGVLGPQTFTATNNASPPVLLAALRSEAAGFYRSLKKPRYEAGWLKRAYA